MKKSKLIKLIEEVIDDIQINPNSEDFLMSSLYRIVPNDKQAIVQK